MENEAHFSPENLKDKGSGRKMRNERLIELRRFSRDGDWPTYYVITDSGCYEYTGQSFVKGTLPPTATVVAVPSEYVGSTIADVRGDGESAVIRLTSEDVIVFDLLVDPFGSMIKSHRDIRFVEREHAKEWRDEYDAMEPL